jgi:hypothetical protein
MVFGNVPVFGLQDKMFTIREAEDQGRAPVEARKV